MHTLSRRETIHKLLLLGALSRNGFGDQAAAGSESGVCGGRLVALLRSEPRTLNPITAMDAVSREVIRRTNADLITINRLTQSTEPALAQSWTVSKDGTRFTLRLRPGLRFSDGHPCDASDVAFSFEVYLNEKINSPQRDLLVVNGQPIAVRQHNSLEVVFELAGPYAAAERIFDSLAILPRHLLETSYRQGTLAEAWGLTVAPAQIAGMGPFRLKEYRAGERVVVERNPFYWKADRQGQRLPYLEEIEFRFAGSEDGQVMRFRGGEADVLDRVSPRNFALLENEMRGRGYRFEDLGPGLEYNFLFFNLNPVDAARSPELAARQQWFERTEFRQAISAAIDREGIVRLVYGGRGAPLRTHVSPGNRRWVNPSLPPEARSIERARTLLAKAGFSRGPDGVVRDSSGRPAEFSLAVSTSSPERVQMATMIQDDLKPFGIKVQVASLEFRSLLDRILHSHQFDAAILGLGGGDADPNGDANVLLSSGATHLWRPGQKQAATPWEAEIDRLMRLQMVALNAVRRKQLYDRVQELESQYQPMICLASPHVLVAAKAGLGNFRPTAVDPSPLWNAEALFWKPNAGRVG